VDVTWHGQSCFRLRGKNATAVTDPFPSSIGIKPPKLEADVVTISHPHPGHSNVEAITTKDVFVVEGPGEYEVKGITVFGIRAFHDALEGAQEGGNTIFVLEVDDIRICRPDRGRWRLGRVSSMVRPLAGEMPPFAVLSWRSVDRSRGRVEPRQRQLGGALGPSSASTGPWSLAIYAGLAIATGRLLLMLAARNRDAAKKVDAFSDV